MSLHFVFCLHNHQPVGNFGFVLERVYQESYAPFLDVLSRHSKLKVVLHFSGVLYQWLEKHHPDFLDRLGSLSREGRIEFLSGGFYEPILSVIPEKDRVGQLEKMKIYLEKRFGQVPQGMWLAERVWEPTVPRHMADAGLSYVVVDDFHLRAAGVTGDEIVQPYLTADGDKVVSVIGGSEKLRYLIPYEDPEKSILYLSKLHKKYHFRNLLVAMADDGEKLGAWPGTFKRVYQEQWLERFFSLLEENRDWLITSTFAEALSVTRPVETVYLPTVSYMEMSEWTLSPDESTLYTTIKDILAASNDLNYTTHVLRGGYWRNFLTKYPESRYLLGRMFNVSKNVHSWEGKLSAQNVPGHQLFNQALEELWLAQCNDAYWHGVFGGLYLPFLRSAAYEHLIKAESALERIEWGEGDFISVDSADLNGDGKDEIIIKNRLLTITVDPCTGLALELDYKPKAINIFNTLNRREEAYHRRIRNLNVQNDGQGVQSIHHIEGLKEGQSVPSIVYDCYPRRAFMSHCWEGEYLFEDWCNGIMPGNWLDHNFFNHVRHGPIDNEFVLELDCRKDTELDYRKTISLARSDAIVSLGFKPPVSLSSLNLFAGQEVNLSPTSLEKSVLEITDGRNQTITAPLARKTFKSVTNVALFDTIKSFAIRFEFAEPVALWICPLATVSNSESGYEEIFQQLSLLFWSKISTRISGSLAFSIKMS